MIIRKSSVPQTGLADQTDSSKNLKEILFHA